MESINNGILVYKLTHALTTLRHAQRHSGTLNKTPKHAWTKFNGTVCQNAWGRIEILTHNFCFLPAIPSRAAASGFGTHPIDIPCPAW